MRTPSPNQKQEKKIPEGCAMPPTIALFDADTIDNLPWPENTDGTYARSFLLPLIRYGPTHFIENVTTTSLALLIDGQIVLPLTLNNQEYMNSYVCSPYSHYIGYAREELILVPQKWLRQALALLINSFGWLCTMTAFNRVIHINNWLLSTNLYPTLNEAQIAAVITFLKARYPHHAIIFRSLNGTCNPSLIEACTRSGCQLIPSRQIYLISPADPTSISSKARWLLKRDLALIEKHGYTITPASDLDEEDIPRIVELYNKLYLDKYSLYNPMFNAHFIQLALHENILQLVACKKEGRIDAVLGYFCRNGVMTTPLFGYDTDLPQEIGLYRMLSALLFHIAREQSQFLHQSSGAAQFKRNRGAYAEIEYSALFIRHLPWHRWLCWLILEGCLNKLALPLLKKYRL